LRSTTEPVEAAGARRLALAGAVGELATVAAMERRLAGIRLGGAYEEGAPHHLGRAAKALIAAGATVTAARGHRSRPAAVDGGALVTAGAVAERWSVFLAGKRSAARPEDTVASQRAAMARGEAPGSARRSPRVTAAAASTDGHRPGERPVTPGSPAIGS